MNNDMKALEMLAYNAGRGARLGKMKKYANPYSRVTNLWAWWMAGWNDKDIEMG